VTLTHQARSVGYIPQGILDIGWWAVFFFLLAVVFLEAQATYWIGSGVTMALIGRRRSGDSSARTPR
jgi:hypothetical protein